MKVANLILSRLIYGVNSHLTSVLSAFSQFLHGPFQHLQYILTVDKTNKAVKFDIATLQKYVVVLTT